MKAPEEPFSLVDEKGEYVNPRFLRLAPGMVVPRIPVYSPNETVNERENSGGDLRYDKCHEVPGASEF